MNKSDNRQTVKYVNEFMERDREMQEAAKRYADNMIREIKEEKSEASTPSSPKITIKDINEAVERDNKEFPLVIDESTTLTRASMKGSKIYYDYVIGDGFIVADENTLMKNKKDIAKGICEFYASYKPIYGDDIFDQLAKLGVSYNLRIYFEGEKTPVRTITIPISYIKKFDKS